jgi:hypothetical protein
LAPEEVATIDALDTGVRGGPEREMVDTKSFTTSVEDHYAQLRADGERSATRGRSRAKRISDKVNLRGPTLVGLSGPRTELPGELSGETEDTPVHIRRRCLPADDVGNYVVL